ncbi:DUF3431 superfamily domain-containing protein [Histoplasma ohiense]|nr:DUF3431 superfamily domain-containing protein [Histoplasma ohiense (nom. inval.)]
MALPRAYRPGSPRLLRKPPAISGIVLLAYLAVFCLLCSVAKYCVASFLASLRYYHPARPHRELVVAAMSSDNTSWLHEYLPDWGRKVYVVDDPDAPLTVPSNKGREAMVYLTYIIDHYDRLPAHIVFIHPQRYQWHNDDPLYDNVPLLRNLRLPFLAQQGYLNLRCIWLLGCPVEIRPFTDIHRADVHAGAAFKAGFEALFPGSPVPREVGVSCCAQFAVTAAQVHKRPRSEYEHFRRWLLSTPLPDELSGRIFEYSWHMIFGRDPVHCPTASECYCKQYGYCNISCRNIGTCEGRYTMPPFASLPRGWPDFGWDGKPRHPGDPIPAREPPKHLQQPVRPHQRQRQQQPQQDRQRAQQPATG